MTSCALFIKHSKSLVATYISDQFMRANSFEIEI